MAFEPYELEPAFLEQAKYKSEITESVEKKLEMGKQLEGDGPSRGPRRLDPTEE